MAISTYVQKIKDEKNTTYTQLAKDIGVSYQKLMSYKNGSVQFPSLKFLKKLASYENKSPEDVLYDAIDEDFNERMDRISLKYLCKKYADGYAFVLQYHIINQYYIKGIAIDGAYYKTRVSNSYILVQSWESLCKQHWEPFYMRTHIPYTRDSFAEIFLNEHCYFANIIAFAVQRLSISNDKAIKGYDLLFPKKYEYEYGNCKEFLPEIKHIKISLILLDE